MKIFSSGSKGDRKKGEVMKEPVIIGVGGPVGSGKTLLIERVTRMMANDYKIAVITNDIYTKEDAMFMVRKLCFT